MPEDDSTPGKGRIEAFSDGVLAIMVLELHIPAWFFFPDTRRPRASPPDQSC